MGGKLRQECPAPQPEVEPWQAELRQPVEALVLGGLAMGRAARPTRIVPQGVTFRHARDPGAAQVEAFARAPVEWGAATDELVLEPHIFATPLPHSGPLMADVLESHA